MKHEEIKGKIMAFMDGEVKSDIKDEIAQHIASCPQCLEEFEALSGVDSYLKNAGEISPPAYFRENIVRKLNESKARRFEFNILKLIPVSAALAVFVLFASALMIVSPYIYAGGGQDASKQAADSVKSAVITCMTSSVFAPAAYAALCGKCSENMCKSCMAKDPNHICQCGGHKHGK